MDFRTCIPLLRVDEIEDRQSALLFLHEKPTLVEDCRASLKSLSDIEKLMSAIHCAGVKLPADHPENRAVYYEQASNAKAKISRLVTCLNDLTSICDMVILTFSRIACVSKLTAFVGFKIGFQFFQRI